MAFAETKANKKNPQYIEQVRLANKYLNRCNEDLELVGMIFPSTNNLIDYPGKPKKYLQLDLWSKLYSLLVAKKMEEPKKNINTPKIKITVRFKGFK